MRHFKFISTHRELSRFLAGLVCSGLFALLTTVTFRQVSKLGKNLFKGREIDCVLDFGQYRIGDNETLLAGLSYEMLRDFAEENACKVNVRSFRRREKSLDSLRSGATDLVILPKFDSVRHTSHIDSVIKSVPVCKEVCWVMRAEDSPEMRQLNGWIEDYVLRDGFPEMVERFRAMPSSRRPHSSFIESQRLSPYDSIIRSWADSIGWDWRMLAAVIYTESKFAINVTSNAGAKGLMQLMPLTARTYGVRNTLDPDENIRAGASYLAHLNRLFRRYADGDERLRYVFASYNAGETRVLRHLNGSGEEKEPSDSTLNAEIDSAAVASAAEPERQPVDSAVTAYIDTIFENYRNFCRICPE